jgi:predicted TIM-barrel fold metal-dependent hydrolase
MRAVAQRPNVTVKVSALGTNDHAWTRASIEPFVRETIEIFGPSRTMFGSNFPVDSLYSSFAELYGAFEEITDDLPDAERRALFAGTAAAAYRIDAAAPTDTGSGGTDPENTDRVDPATVATQTGRINMRNGR